MPLNPMRMASPRPISANSPSPFQSVADAALSGFRRQRADLEQRVRKGEITVPVARQRAAEAAAELKIALTSQSQSGRQPASFFALRLAHASQQRKVADARASLETLQRQTNQLLRNSLVEQQLASRAQEFEARAYTRPLAGGPAGPTLDSLLSFHDLASRNGDEAAREWARRQLQAMRPRIIDQMDLNRLDQACDRPEQVNPRLVERYLQTLRDRSASEVETFLEQALESHDSSACAAAFLLAKENPEGQACRWVRTLLDRLGEFPDTAIETLRAAEAQAENQERELSIQIAEYTCHLAASEARLHDLVAPSPEDLERQARFGSLPVAQPGEPVGLSLSRRGLRPEELSLESAAAPSDSATNGA